MNLLKSLTCILLIVIAAPFSFLRILFQVIEVFFEKMIDKIFPTPDSELFTAIYRPAQDNVPAKVEIISERRSPRRSRTARDPIPMNDDGSNPPMVLMLIKEDGSEEQYYNKDGNHVIFRHNALAQFTADQCLDKYDWCVDTRIDPVNLERD